MKITMSIFVVVILFLLSSCKAPGLTQQGSQGEAGGLDAGNSAAAGLAGQSESMGKKWPSGLDGIPEFSYGKIVKVLKNTDAYDGISYVSYQIDFENIDNSGCDKYSADLEKAGFEASQPPSEQESVLNGTTYTEYCYEKYAFETDDTILHIDVDFWADSRSIGQVYISVPLMPEGGAYQEQGGASNSSSGDADSGDSEFNWDTLSTAEVPDGYPHDDVPLIGLESGTLLGADRQEMGEMGTSFVVVYGSHEDVGTACDAIATQLEDIVTGKGGSFSAVINGMYLGEINDCEFTVAVGDGTADGYETIITYTVICT